MRVLVCHWQMLVEWLLHTCTCTLPIHNIKKIQHLILIYCLLFIALNISNSLWLPTFIQYIKKQTFKESVAKKYHQKGSRIAHKREVYNMSLIVDYSHSLAVKVSSQHNSWSLLFSWTLQNVRRRLSIKIYSCNVK